MEPAEHATLDERYGVRPARSRKALVAVAAVLLAAGLGWAGWVAQHRSSSEVRAQLIGYQTEERAVIVRLQVRHPRGDAVECTLRARGRDGGVVGRATVRFAGGDTERREVRVETSARPVNGEIETCAAAAGG